MTIHSLVPSTARNSAIAITNLLTKCLYRKAMHMLMPARNLDWSEEVANYATIAMIVVEYKTLMHIALNSGSNIRISYTTEVANI